MRGYFIIINKVMIPGQPSVPELPAFAGRMQALGAAVISLVVIMRVNPEQLMAQPKSEKEVPVKPAYEVIHIQDVVEIG